MNIQGINNAATLTQFIKLVQDARSRSLGQVPLAASVKRTGAPRPAGQPVAASGRTYKTALPAKQPPVAEQRPVVKGVGRYFDAYA